MKVIIVGGSIAGLTLALALERAGVDFVLLEASPEIGPQLGASLGLHPHGIKILDQLGVWKDLSKLVVPLRAGKHFDSTGYCFAESKYLEMIENDLGYPTVFLERSQFLSAMYDHVQDKSKVLAGKVFASYTEERNTVFVRTMDGSEYAGDILVGADGVHSRVRKVMSETVKEELPGGACIEPDDAGFTSEYKAIFAISRTSPEICPVPEGHVYNTYFQNHSTVVASGVPGLIFWFLFVKTPQYLPPDIPRYINEDAQKLIDEYQNIRLCPEFTVKEAWEARTKGVLLQLEEGILDRWSHGRVVLVGDAIHKVTINAGLGGNLAMEGVVTLTNLLHSALRQIPRLSEEKIANIFTAYKATHLPRAELVFSLSSHVTRLEAQDGILMRLASRWIAPFVSDNLKAMAYCSFSRGGALLNDEIMLKEEEREDLFASNLFTKLQHIA